MTNDRPRIAVTYVTAPACHLCDHGREVLAELAATYPLEIREVAITTHEGLEALTSSRAPFPPVLLLDGHPAAHGRLSARRLAHVLDRLTATVIGG